MSLGKWSYKKSPTIYRDDVNYNEDKKNKLEGASNYRAWKKRIYLILTKHKVLDLIQGKVMKPTDDVEKENFREIDILAMILIVDGVMENLIPYISNIDSPQEMYESLSKLFTINNIGQITSVKNEIRKTKMKKDYIVS